MNYGGFRFLSYDNLEKKIEKEFRYAELLSARPLPF